jgi:hypothetical protein
MLLLPLAAVASAAPTAPSFDAERGFHDAPFTLTIAPSDPGDTVYYSVDGTLPTTPWAGPLEIGGTTLVRAQEVAGDGTASDVVTATYLSLADVLASPVMDPAIVNDPAYATDLAGTLTTLPSISIVTDAALSTSEQAVSFEWIDPAGDDVQVNCGARLTGTTSLAYPKNSIRLYFRDDYGPSSLAFDLWGPDPRGVAPSTDNDALSLRTGHDSVFYLGAQGQYTRNYWMDATQLDMGHLAPHGRFAHVYQNGGYFGLYQVRERFNRAFLANYLGGDEDDYEAVNGGAVIAGEGSAWAQVLANESSYAGIQPWLNVPDFLDYMVLNFYAGNAWDWSSNHNWMAVGPTEGGAGGFRFESSDSDICLYYDYTVNILSNPGPSSVFGYLLLEADPDFLVALEDAIHRNLEAGGPLTAENAAARYTAIAAEAEDAVVAESARWGYGWWDRDGEWVTERDRLLNQYFPYRTDELLRQVRAAGWYPLDAPTLSLAGGLVATGTPVTVAVPEGSAAELWVSLDGADPRLSGGAVSAGALGPDATRGLTIDRSTVVKARLRDAGTWGPLAEGFYEVDAAPPIVLNEWNAVDDGELLGGDGGDGDGGDGDGGDGDGADDALGRVPGNGGDWIELLVVEDGLDLRGWRLTMEDRRGPAGELVFSDDPLLASLRAGTILTVAEDLPEDAAYDPDAGDWRFHLRAAVGASGRYVTAADFDVTAHDWQLTLWDPDGHVRFGPAGEGVAPASGIAASEVGLLAEDPSPGLRRTSAGYTDGRRSTYGAPNVWDGGMQDLSALRGGPGGVVDLGDTGGGGGAAVAGDGAGERGCGCGGGGAGGGLGVLLGVWVVGTRVAGTRRPVRGRSAGGVAR